MRGSVPRAGGGLWSLGLGHQGFPPRHFVGRSRRPVGPGTGARGLPGLSSAGASSLGRLLTLATSFSRARLSICGDKVFLPFSGTSRDSLCVFNFSY